MKPCLIYGNCAYAHHSWIYNHSNGGPIAQLMELKFHDFAHLQNPNCTKVAWFRWGILTLRASSCHTRSISTMQPVESLLDSCEKGMPLERRRSLKIFIDHRICHRTIKNYQECWNTQSYSTFNGFNGSWNFQLSISADLDTPTQQVTTLQDQLSNSVPTNGSVEIHEAPLWPWT